MLKRHAPAHWLAIVVALACMLLFLLRVTPLAAQTNGVDLPPLTLQPGQEVTLSIKALCIQYTAPFPRTFPPIVGLADPKYVQIMRYALSKGYVDSDPYQVQLALWRASTGRWVNTYPRARAEEIFNNAGQAPPPPPGAGQSLLDAITANAVQVNYRTWGPGPERPARQRATLAGDGRDRRPQSGHGSPDLEPAAGPFPGRPTASPGHDSDLYPQPAAGHPHARRDADRRTGTPSPQATPRATPRLPHSGIDKPDDPGYLILVLGGLLFVAGLAVDLARRYHLASAGNKKTPRQF